MKYSVLLTHQATRELREATGWIAKEAPTAATQWYHQAVQTLQTLSSNPQRCRQARESDRFPYDLFQIFIGRDHRYRAVFTIRDNEVVVLSIRHTARRELLRSDLSSENG